MKLYVRFERQGSINDFLLKFFNLDNTTHVSSKAVATYRDTKCLKLQCGEGRMRSFDDMFIIVKTYYPSTTEKILMDKLLKLTLNRKLPDIYVTNAFYIKGNYKILPQLAACSTMRRVRIFYSITNLLSQNNPFTANKYNSKKSWAELLPLLGINNFKDYKNYLQKHTNTLNTKAV